jgi:uncharacterized protein (DUF2252 family)
MSKSTSKKTSGSGQAKRQTEQVATVQPAKPARGRFEAFRDLSERIAAGDLVVPPVMLNGEARRLHVRSTIREDHKNRIQEGRHGARAKFEKLATSRYSFFRGTALLFYRDMAGTDAHQPTVLALGDVHPENFGVMPNAEGVPIFSVNDFDETMYAPFTWDIKRGAVGFWVGAQEEGDLNRKHRRRIVRAFVKGYLEAMEDFARNGHEKRNAFNMTNSPKVIRRLFEEAWEERKDWLWDDYLDPSGLRFRADDELEPISSQVDKFQKAVHEVVAAKGIEVPARAGELKVKDVCIRHGQGTASLGLPRYYVLIEGPSKDATDDLIIEFKTARRSALAGVAPPSEFEAGDKAERIAHGQSVHLAYGDVFYGAVEIDGQSFMSRERAPFRDDIDLDELSKSTWRDFAHVCGRALAQAHALSDDLGEIDYDVEPSIVAASSPRNLFIADILNWTEEAADRLKHDHRAFIQDFELGAFEDVDIIYR